MISHPCGMCGATVEGDDLDAYGWAAVAHVRATHPDLPYGDTAVRNFFEGEARATGGTDRLDVVGDVEIHPVTGDRVDDWLDFFDHHAMVGTPENSACYCLEPHDLSPARPPTPVRHWRERRADMVERLGAGSTYGYLAYVDGRPAAWINASLRSDCSLFRRSDDADANTVSVSCFAVAPPYRRHGLSRRLLDRAVADARDRGADAVEAYPGNGTPGVEPMGFRGPRPLYESAGFTEIKVRRFDTVVRRPV